MGFDFNYNPVFGPVGDVFIAEFGSEAPETTGGMPAPCVGHRVFRIDMRTGRISTFAVNKSGVAASLSGEGGLERPIDAVFGPDGSLYNETLKRTITTQYVVAVRLICAICCGCLHQKLLMGHSVTILP